MGCSDKNGLPADPVHVDTSSSLQIIQMDVAIFGDEKNYILLGTDLDIWKDKSSQKNVNNEQKDLYQNAL